MENGACVIPWGRARPDSGSPRKDILNAMKRVEDGGLGHGEKFLGWCEENWKPFVSKGMGNPRLQRASVGCDGER